MLFLKLILKYKFSTKCVIVIFIKIQELKLLTVKYVIVRNINGLNNVFFPWLMLLHCHQPIISKSQGITVLKCKYTEI